MTEIRRLVGNQEILQDPRHNNILKQIRLLRGNLGEFLSPSPQREKRNFTPIKILFNKLAEYINDLVEVTENQKKEKAYLEEQLVQCEQLIKRVEAKIESGLPNYESNDDNLNYESINVDVPEFVTRLAILKNAIAMKRSQSRLKSLAKGLQNDIDKLVKRFGELNPTVHRVIQEFKALNLK